MTGQDSVLATGWMLLSLGCADGNAMFLPNIFLNLICSLIIGYNASDKNGYDGKIH